MKTIQKMGTIDIDLVETTPIVFNGKLYRLEYIRAGQWGYKRNILGRPYHRLLDVATGEVHQPFAQDHDLGSAIVDNQTVYVFAVNGWGSEKLDVFYSDDLKNWSSKTALHLPGWRIFNNSVGKANKGYVMAFEIDAPPEEAGVPFTVRFVRSKDLLSWELTDPKCVYSKDRYTAYPTLRFFDGHYYMTYLEEKPGPFYETYIVRSKDLIHWESSFRNPVLTTSAEDKKIGVSHFNDSEREYIAKAVNINNSDMDYCEFNGQTVIQYSWGNQHGNEFLAHAIYDGKLKEFLEGYFPH